MCCIIDGSPIDDEKGRYNIRQTGQMFQVSMMDALMCKSGPAHCIPWFCGQCLPPCMGITQYCLRRKVLDGDMKLYSCCQGYYNCCCFKSGQCCEDTCPDLCLCIEGCCCNSCAISASRAYTMEKYDLQSDACDYRLIRINNCLQILSCICQIAALIDESFRELAQIINCIADIFYHTMTGCMTVQVAKEIDYQRSIPEPVTQITVVSKDNYS
jgi:hypothetical protein